jgi:Protein of unknown function (DUF5661)
MKKNWFLLISAILIVGFASIPIIDTNSSTAQNPDLAAKYEEYRAALKKAYQIDIVNFKDKIKGGYADGKAITDYDLEQLLEGTKWEREHTDDSLLALEIAMDHLERFPHYYSYHTQMEAQMLSERLLGM